MEHLEFSKGGTRFVLLYGNRAYKIARFPLIRMLFRFVLHLVRREVLSKLEQFGPTHKSAVIQYIFGGIFANRDEWYISERYPSPDRAKVLSIHLFGLVVVQERGQPLCPNQSPERHPLWNMMLRHKYGDVSQARAQFAMFDGSVKLIDLGRGDFDSGVFP